MTIILPWVRKWREMYTASTHVYTMTEQFNDYAEKEQKEFEERLADEQKQQDLRRSEILK